MTERSPLSSFKKSKFSKKGEIIKLGLGRAELEEGQGKAELEEGQGKAELEEGKKRRQSYGDEDDNKDEAMLEMIKQKIVDLLHPILEQI